MSLTRAQKHQLMKRQLRNFLDSLCESSDKVHLGYETYVGFALRYGEDFYAYTKMSDVSDRLLLESNTVPQRRTSCEMSINGALAALASLELAVKEGKDLS